MNTIIREGVIYTRVSSLKQVTEGSGLDSQYSACLTHANENKITVLESFQDAAYSGKTTDRPGLEKLIAFLKERKSKTLLTHPDKAWKKANSKVKKIIFNFVFEKNLKVVDGRIGTASYTLPYRLLSNNSITKNGMVEPRGIEPLTSTLPVLRSPS